ncbi:hypothetical protein [Xenorhabdus innexi]|uniref:Outer membrane protein NilC n=1 Tax=Xenorhabdus innexi TaxID=290109 RepID=A0A1N6N058_9GAMM|nr:hypothetical protein [Xenorhabdus innexi]PHM37720.1 outer membrane protein NilC [Xenorhabdus innexi]SIP74445.1 exported hypothetical protein [Xenorhabdus innexi]
MNTKSKIFLVLALVLSVTACSKGGGNRYNLTNHPGKVTPPERTEKNTLTLYKNFLRPPAGDRTNPSLNEYTGFSNIDGPPGGDPNPDATGKSLSDYVYVMIDANGLKDKYVLVNGKEDLNSKDKRYTNKDGTILIGSIGGHMYRAQSIQNDPSKLTLAHDVPHHYEGKALHDTGKVALDMYIDITFHKDNSIGFEGYLDKGGNYESHISDTVKTMSNSPIDQPYLQPIKITATGTSSSGLVHGSVLGGEFTEGGSGFGGTYNNPDHTVEGNFALSRKN